MTTARAAHFACVNERSAFIESENRSQTVSPADHLHPDDSACIPTGPTESDSHSAPQCA